MRCKARAGEEGEVRVTLCLELPNPLNELLSSIAERIGVRVEELIVEAIENYLKIVERIDRHYMKEFKGNSIKPRVSREERSR